MDPDGDVRLPPQAKTLNKKNQCLLFTCLYSIPVSVKV